jgi:tRNA threonylcarbamoyladenosine biosynthesis protein TsaB
VVTLAIDTSETRGSIAVLRDGALASCRRHVDQSDYSEWLLPAVNQVLAEANTKIEQIQLLAVSTGPGSFTGLRVGLTTAKAWAEVYGTPIVGVSRLEALACHIQTSTPLVASSYDAFRGQLFAGVYRQSDNHLERFGAELVVSPEEFVRMVDAKAASEHVSWISLDPQLIQDLDLLRKRIAAGDSLLPASADLAPTIGKKAEERAGAGDFSDPLSLDANYVRRSDAEIFWQGSSSVR